MSYYSKVVFILAQKTPVAYFSNWHVLFLNVCTRVKVSSSWETFEHITYNTLWKGTTLNICEPQINVVLILIAALHWSNIPVCCSVLSRVSGQ